MVKILIVQLSLFVLLVGVSMPIVEANDSLEGLSKEYVKNDITRFSAKGLDRLVKDGKIRKSYTSKLYLNFNIEKEIKKLQLDKTEAIIMQLHQARMKILTDALIKNTLEAKQLDLLALAKERYELNKSIHRTRRKIKLSQIFIAKIPGHEDTAKEKIEDVFEKLKSKGVSSFDGLAKEFSEDKRAKNGGLLRKWILEPDFKKGNVTPPIKAVFALNKIGQISPIIETNIGFHIMKLMADTPSIPLTFDDVKIDIVNELKKELWFAEKNRLLGKLSLDKPVSINDEVMLDIVKKALKERLK